MQPQPMLTSSGLAFFPLIILAVLVIVTIAAIRHGYGKVVLGVGACLLCLIFVAGFSTVRISVPSTRVEQSATIAYDSATDSPASHVESSTASDGSVNPVAPSIPGGPPPSQILYTTGNAQPIPIQELPGWRKNPPHEGSTESGYAKYVLTSEQFATVEEAEAQLFQTLTADVQRGFAHHWPQTIGWVPTPEDIQLSGLITERVDETLTVKVGEFENPVHRVSWLIEFRPDANKALHARWEPIEAQRRSKLILSILAGASGVLGVTAMALRRRRNQPTPETAPANSMA
jgi:hypothetical protein